MEFNFLFKNACDVLGIDSEAFNANVAFVTPDEIRELNLKWRNIDKATDVLSFPFLDFNKPFEYVVKRFETLENAKCLNTLKTADLVDDDMKYGRLVNMTNCKKDFRALFPLDINPVTNKIELGDIIICPECAGEFSLEFLYLHGLLHLLGYDHGSDADEEFMNSVLAQILNIYNSRGEFND